MAKELAAMAKTPSGATMTVVANNYMFYPHRETDTECFPERIGFQPKAAFPTAVAQFL